MYMILDFYSTYMYLHVHVHVHVFLCMQCIQHTFAYECVYMYLNVHYSQYIMYMYIYMYMYLYSWDSLDTFMQHDVQELSRVVCVSMC